MLTRSEIALALRPPRVQASPWVRPSPEGWRAAVAVSRDGRFAGTRYSATVSTETAAYELARAAARSAETAAADLVTTCRLTLAASVAVPFALGVLIAVAL